MAVEITNAEEFQKELNQYLQDRMGAAGDVIVRHIQNKIEDMDLVQRGAQFLQSIHRSFDEDGLVVFSTVDYAQYLEYGTYAYHDIHGFKTYPASPDPKKKDMPKKDRKSFPKGMQPFAPFRRGLISSLPELAKVFSNVGKIL